MEKLLSGRELLWNELTNQVRTNIANQQIEYRESKSYTNKNGQSYCNRCSALMLNVKENECVCQLACAYCRNCINMGKVRKCSLFYHLEEQNDFEMCTDKPLLAWAGTLSQQQRQASAEIIQSIQNKETHLIWAVTGAGKTEMLFEGIEYALQNNYRICIATPRVDVCLELMPRIQAAFPKVNLAVLYGDMNQPYEYTQLVLATTHQLFRFREAFDVLIIDEVDAFPFNIDDSLQFAAGKAIKQEATLIYLTATPNQELKNKIKKDEILTTILPARFHRSPLPVPELTWCGNWRKKLLKNPLRNLAGKKVKEKIDNGRRFLLFVPNIEWMLKLEKVFKPLFPTVSFTSVSAADPQRKEKVHAMRNGDLQFLMTSTILERGVTFKDIDVLVLGAEDRIFTEAALVQIAGRCGRSAKYPSGEVVFFHYGKSLAMKNAVKQIKMMNQLAQKRGLLNE